MIVMKHVLAIVLLSLVAVAQAPPAVKSVPPKSSAKASTRPQPLPDQGTVTNSSYSEKFFNLRYTTPQGWVVKTPEMSHGLPEADKAILLLSVFGPGTPSSTAVIPSVTISAESLSLYPQMKTAQDYFDSLSDLVQGKGFSVLNEPAEIQIGGVTFLRGDFQKEEGDITTYQASMVAIRKGYILLITAISGDDEQLTPLLNRVHIFAPPTLKGR